MAGDNGDVEFEGGDPDEGGEGGEFTIDTSAPKGKKSVEEQLAETNRRLEEERLARVKAEGKAEGMTEALSQQPPTRQEEHQEQRYTRAQLNAAVKNEQLSQDDADLMWETQLRKDITREVTQTVSSQVSGQAAVQAISSEIDEYTKLFPNSSVQGSKEHKDLQTEYQKLRNMGQPKGLATELMAAKIVFGPLEKVKAGKEITREVNEGHQEGGGGNNGRPRSKQAGDENKVVLTPRERKYYQDQIDKGIYKDFKEVGEMIKAHANPRIRERSRALG